MICQSSCTQKPIFLLGYATVEVSDTDGVAAHERGERREVPGVDVQRVGNHASSCAGDGSGPPRASI